MLVIDGLYTNGSMLGRRVSAMAAVGLAGELARASIEPGPARHCC
jgi:hypothetical protein